MLETFQENHKRGMNVLELLRVKGFSGEKGPFEITK